MMETSSVVDLLLPHSLPRSAFITLDGSKRDPSTLSKLKLMLTAEMVTLKAVRTRVVGRLNRSAANPRRRGGGTPRDVGPRAGRGGMDGSRILGALGDATCCCCSA